MSSNKDVVRDMIAAFERGDAAGVAACFTEDGSYHNMPTEPVTGRANIEAFVAGFIKDWRDTRWEVLTLMEEGDTVIAERVDRTHVGEADVALPCCGVFLMEEGKIALWRDYFDLATYTNALAKAE